MCNAGWFYWVIFLINRSLKRVMNVRFCSRGWVFFSLSRNFKWFKVASVEKKNRSFQGLCFQVYGVVLLVDNLDYGIIGMI